MHLARNLILLAGLHAAFAAPAAAQPVLDQALLPQTEPLRSARLTGAYTPASNLSVIDDFTLQSGGLVESIRFIGEAPSNVYGFAVRLLELDAAGQPAELLAGAWPNVANASPSKRSDGLYSFSVDLRSAVRVEPGVRYGLEVNAFLAVPDLRGDRAWTWAAGEGDGLVLVDGLDGAPLSGVPHAGGAFTLEGTPDENACPADVNGDGSLSGADFFAWVAAYSSGDMIADQNADGQLNGADFFAWVANYSQGC